VGDQGNCISVERFGASAPYKVIFEHLGLTVDNVVSRARILLRSNKKKLLAAEK
jgi:transketolase